MPDNHNNAQQLAPSPLLIAPNLEPASSDLDDLLRQRAEMNQQASAIESQPALLAVADRLDQAEQDRFAAFLADVIDAREPDSPAAQRSNADTITARLGLDETEAVTVVPTVQEYIRIRRDIAALEQAALGPAVRQLDTAQQRLILCADWNSIIEQCVQADTEIDPNQLGSALTAVSTSAQSNPERHQNLDEVLRNTRAVNNYYDKVASAGLLRPGSVEEYERLADRKMTVVTETQPVNLADRIEDWTYLTECALAYTYGERNAAVEGHLPNPQLTRLSVLIEAAEAEEVGLPMPIAKAMRRVFRNLCETFDQVDSQYLARKCAEPYDGPLISGADLLGAITDIEDPAAWVSRLPARFPGWYTHGLAAITIAESLDDHHRVTNTDNIPFPSIGEYDRSGRKITLLASPDEFGQSLLPTVIQGEERPPMYATEAEARTKFRAEIQGASDHEITHHAHCNTLPIRWLRKWQAVLAAEKAVISVYTTLCRQQLSRERADIEDLCESVELYKNNPAYLFWNASQRFHLINELLQEFSPAVEDAYDEVSRLSDAGEAITWDRIIGLIEAHRLPNEHQGHDALPYST